MQTTSALLAAALLAAVIALSTFAVVPAVVADADDEDDSSSASGAAKAALPFLLVDKHFSATELIVGQDVTVRVTVTNVGRSPAFNVKLTDQIQSVPHDHAVAKLDVGQSTNMTYTHNAGELGLIATDAAKVTYRIDDSASAATKEAFSTKANEELEGQGVDKSSVLVVMTAAQYEKKHTRHTKEWATFVFLLLFPLGMPLYFFMTRSSELALLEAETKKLARAGSAKKLQ